MFVGQIDLESTLTFLILTTNTSSVPTASDATPTYEVYSSSFAAPILTGGTTVAVSGKTGAYYPNLSVTAASGFAAGQIYHLVASWSISAAARQQVYEFLVT